MADPDDRPGAPHDPSLPAGNPGYALGQLARVLTTSQTHPESATRERADRRAADWLRVFGGMVSGTLRVGSRTPVRGAPGWVTTQVLGGGFATGEFAAGGPLEPHEETLLDDLPAADRSGGRAALNAFHITEAGLGRLAEALDSGRYRVDVPEEGALLAVAWLATRGHADAAREVLDEIGPWFGRLRFYPAPAVRPLPDTDLVRLHDVADVVRRLRGARVPGDILTMQEALSVWVLHADRIAALIAETVEGPEPRLVSEGADGTSAAEGGWPFQAFPPGWTERARAALADYEALRADHARSGKPERLGANPARLRHALALAAADPARLTGLDVGRVRTALAQIDAKRGLPGSERLAALRTEQARIAALPTKVAWATALAERLDGHSGGGLTLADVEALLAPVTPEETGRHGLPAGAPFPESVRPSLLRAVDASPEEHVAWGTIRSGEALARVVPRLAAQARVTGAADAALRRLSEATYEAFRRRRSVLLLNLEHQIRLEELPWVRALRPSLGEGPEVETAARTALERVVTLALTAFPHQILPNKFLREIRALVAAAGLDVPVVDEVAADIFMGTFTEKYLRAAQRAAMLLQGSLYERYFETEPSTILAIGDVVRAKNRVPTSEAFDRLCHARADAEPSGVLHGRSVARNGAVIEQEQVLTTHNLAPLLEVLGAALPFHEMARRTFTWAADELEQLRGPRWGQLRSIKNAAYAWRQMVFYLSHIPEDALDGFLVWAVNDLARRSGAFAARFGPVLADFCAVAESAPRFGAPLYGWDPATAAVFMTDPEMRPVR